MSLSIFTLSAHKVASCLAWGDTATRNCQYCDTPRYKDVESLTPHQEMGIVSVGAALSEMLLDDEVREMMGYRHIATQNHEAGVYSDIFDGAIYRDVYLNERNLFKLPADIGLLLYLDGFPSKHSPRNSLAIIHCIVMNFDPSLR